MTTKSKVSSKKIAASSRAAKQPYKPSNRPRRELLERFAAEHHLELSSWENHGQEIPQIELGDSGGSGDDLGGSFIHDPYDDFVEGMLWGVTDKNGRWYDTRRDAKFLKEVRDRELLCLTMFCGQISILYERIGFDLPSYDKGLGLGDMLNPNSSKWGKKLHRIGIDCIAADGTAVCFSFPSNRPDAVEMVFKLALTTAP